MWGMLTAESFTPFLEFDFIGSDSAKMMGKTLEEFDALGKPERNDLIQRLSRRLEKVGGWCRLMSVGGGRWCFLLVVGPTGGGWQ